MHPLNALRITFLIDDRSPAECLLQSGGLTAYYSEYIDVRRESGIPSFDGFGHFGVTVGHGRTPGKSQGIRQGFATVHTV